MKKKFLTLGFLIVVFLVNLFNLLPVWAVTTDSVSATIQISVCGNEIIEGGEDCEGADLNSQTCVGLGYAGGTLVCDIACSFDTTACTAVTSTSTPTNTPTPTLTPTPTATATPTSTPTAQPAATNTPAPAATATPGPQATNTPPPAPTPVPVIPAVVAVFDLDASGKIETTEVFSVVKSWVEEWTEAVKEELAAPAVSPATAARPKKCDINRDRKCDLFDLSILLYYVGK